ncbi:hypothetical protein DLAC_00082 [Tieghemostelium lacteum]|uniref:Transmembrane protein n=1 Tax=Tieghemostelium lacteum TaxID=361077 RepID=A0A152A8R2_TIELA|nr:hypothetical protein DLAC_00082 [Tieghemostelium lacteum]|eukprot:KYR02633.1 hypothetical protein DLAC_00082 [Tieghemostelium lacteum]
MNFSFDNFLNDVRYGECKSYDEMDWEPVPITPSIELSPPRFQFRDINSFDKVSLDQIKQSMSKLNQQLKINNDIPVIEIDRFPSIESLSMNDFSESRIRNNNSNNNKILNNNINQNRGLILLPQNNNYNNSSTINNNPIYKRYQQISNILTLLLCLFIMTILIKSSYITYHEINNRIIQLNNLNSHISYQCLIEYHQQNCVNTFSDSSSCQQQQQPQNTNQYKTLNSFKRSLLEYCQTLKDCTDKPSLNQPIKILHITLDTVSNGVTYHISQKSVEFLTFSISLVFLSLVLTSKLFILKKIE